MAKSFLVTVTNDLNQDQRMHRICNSLVDEGHNVLLLGRTKRSSSSLLDFPFDQKRLNCFFSKGALFYLEHNLRILFYALKMKPDVIYSVDLDTLFAGSMAKSLLKNKLIHDAHEYFVEVPELEGASLKKRIWNWIGKRFVPNCDLCITVNQELAEILSEKYNNEFHVVRSAPILNENFVVTKKENDPPVVLYQGVLNKGRGLEEAIRAIHLLQENVVFKIAGEGDLSKELRSLANKLNVENKVKFLGWLSPDHLKQETLKADIGLNLLSAASLNYKYSLANKFFDYMHANVPSINMNFPVYKRVCSEYEVGICIDALDAESIQKAILTLLTDKDRLGIIEKACDEARLKYNWGNESTILKDLMKEYVWAS